MGKFPLFSKKFKIKKYKIKNMKKIILFLLPLWALCANSYAQKNIDEKKIATQLCECVEKTFKQYPKVLREMIIDSAEMGDEKAQEKMEKKVKKMSTTEQENLTKAMERPIEVELEKNCGNVSKFIKKQEQGESLDMKKVLKLMKANKNCKVAYALMQKVK